MTGLQRLILSAISLSVCVTALSHDDTVGARFVMADGTNASDCLEHHAPCQSIQYALSKAEPGNTVKVGAGIFDLSGVPPETYLFGPIKAAGGYAEEDHFSRAEPDANPSILVGVDPRYRQAVIRQGFKWAADKASAEQGMVDDSPAVALQSTQVAPATCSGGFAGQFPCRNVDFQSQLALNQFSQPAFSMSNLWGFVDLNDNREYAVVGLSNGTAIVEVTDAAHPREVALIAGTSSTWREVKVYQYKDQSTNRYRAYAYVSTEAANAGLQVLDLSGLPSTVTLATTLRDTGSQHTLYISNIDYSSNTALAGAEAYLYVAGANANNGAWRVYSLANPAAPTLIATAPAGSQYMHDSTSLYVTDSRTTQCDQGHNPCQILVDFNENTVDLWDVTDKENAVRLSSTTYPTVSYTHSGWPTADGRNLIFHDEYEEIRRGLNTEIYTMDLSDLRSPSIVVSYQGSGTATDHNGYIKGNYDYVSHYRRGLVIFDVSDAKQLKEVASFDTFLSPAENTAGTDGAWGVYPFLPSGTVLISDISNGLFVVRPNTAAFGTDGGTTTPPSSGGGGASNSGGGGGAVDLSLLGLVFALAMLRVGGRREEKS